MALIDYHSYRDAVKHGLSKGWLRFPMGQQQPEAPVIKAKPAPLMHELVCVQCKHEFYDSVKQCPKCLSPHVRSVKSQPKAK